MSPEAAKKLLTLLGCKPEYNGGAWVRCSCPLAPFTHPSGKDTHPSFAVNVEESKPFYTCYTCQAGGLSELIGALEMHCQKQPAFKARYHFKEARELLDGIENTIDPLPEFTEFQHVSKKFEEWPTYFLDSFLNADKNAEAMKYLMKRGVTLSQVHAHQIKYDTQARRVVFPYWNVYGKLAGMRGRAIDEGAKLKHYDYTWNGVNNASMVWYNEPVLQAEKPIVLVEGQFDCLAVERIYPHVVANLTAKPSEQKKKRLLQSPGVILMLDNDVTGYAARDRWVDYFDEHGVMVASIALPVNVKDPAEADPDWLREQLSHLVEV